MPSAEPAAASAVEPAASAATPVAPRSGPAEVLGRIEEYELLEPIGRGAMGQVFRAHDTLLDRPVAIKLIASAKPTELAQERFLIEARAIARLHHPNVVAIYRVGRYRGRLYIVSELLTGQSLDRLPLPQGWPAVLSLAHGIARGLAAAHHSGVLHRDIKPANVMIGADGSAKLLDFGLAKLSAGLRPSEASSSDTLRALLLDDAGEAGAQLPERGDATALAPTIEDVQGSAPAVVSGASDHSTPALTVAGAILGTPGYMAPEVWEGRTATARSDLYSFGALLFELLAGRLPYDSKRLDELGTAVTSTDAPRLLALVPELPPRFAALVQRCLARSPEARPASAEAVRSELESLQAEQEQARARQHGLRTGRRRWLVLGALLMLLSLGALAAHRQRAHEAAVAESGAARARRSIAVLPVAVLPVAVLPGAGPTAPAPSRSQPWRVFSELLGHELSIGAQLRRLPAETVAAMQLELGLPGAATYALPVLGAVRRYLGADLVAISAWEPAGDGSVRIRVNIQDTQTGAIAASSTVSGRPGELFELVARAAGELRHKLGYGTLSSEQSSQLRAARPATPQTAELYAQGLDKLRHFDAAGARAPLEQLITHEPDFPLGHLALAEALTSLGYEHRAQEHLRRALELSRALAPEQRFQIETRYYLSTQEWERAFLAYRALRGAYPESLEYGLGLAEAQLTASRPQEALGTVQSLRALSEPAQRDPRIDLLEGRALMDLGQSRGAIEQLERAAARAREAGSPLLMARAHLEASYAFGFAGEHVLSQQAAERAVELYRRTGDRGRLAEAQIAIAGAQMNRGALQDALGAAQSALGTLMELKNVSVLSDHLSNVAMLLARRGHLAEALARAEGGYLLAREVDRAESISGNLVSIGWIALLQGRLERAEQALLEAHETLVRVNNVRNLAWVRWHLGNLRLQQGRLDEARSEHLQGLRVRTENGLKGFAAESELALAALELAGGRPAEAALRARAAVQQFASEQQRDLEAQAQALLSEALILLGQRGPGQVALERALALNRQSQDLISQLEVARRAIGLQALSLRTLPREAALRQLEALLATATGAGLGIEALELRRLRLQLGDGPGAAPLDARHDELRLLLAQAKGLGLELFVKKTEGLVKGRSLPPSPVRTSR